MGGGDRVVRHVGDEVNLDICPMLEYNGIHQSHTSLSSLGFRCEPQDWTERERAEVWMKALAARRDKSPGDSLVSAKFLGLFCMG